MGYAAAAVVLAAFSSSQAERAEDRAYAEKQAGQAEQRKIQSEQKAQNEAQRAGERRKQLREERIRRAQIIQAGINTGTAESSGEEGALGGLATQRGAGIGFNIGVGEAANRISIASQAAADAFGNAQSHMVSSNQWAGASNMFLNFAASTAAKPSQPNQYTNTSDFTTPQNPGPMQP